MRARWLRRLAAPARPFGPFCDGGSQDQPDLVGVEHHVLPREPQHQPAVHRESVVAACVTAQRPAMAVPLERVGLDDDAQPLVDQVRPPEELLPVPDRDLGHHLQAGHLQGDRPQGGFESVGRSAVGAAGNPPGQGTAGTAQVARERQQSLSTESVTKRRVGDAQGIGKRSAPQAVHECSLGSGEPAGRVVGAQVGAVEVDP